MLITARDGNCGEDHFCGPRPFFRNRTSFSTWQVWSKWLPHTLRAHSDHRSQFSYFSYALVQQRFLAIAQSIITRPQLLGSRPTRMIKQRWHSTMDHRSLNSRQTPYNASHKRQLLFLLPGRGIKRRPDKSGTTRRVFREELPFRSCDSSKLI